MFFLLCTIYHIQFIRIFTYIHKTQAFENREEAVKGNILQTHQGTAS